MVISWSLTTFVALLLDDAHECLVDSMPANVSIIILSFFLFFFLVIARFCLPEADARPAE